MRAKIIQLGRIKTVILISLVSVISSVLIYLPFAYLLEGEVLVTGIIITVIVPMLIAPSVSWYIIGLLIKMHHLEVEMRDLATFDSLTNVMSRKAFLTNAQTIYQLNKREKSSLALLYIDIDDFKKINDTHGHAIGDEVLKDFGHVLKKYKRESDLVGRLGGEEFAFVLPRTDIEGAVNFAEHLKNIINSNIVTYEQIHISYTVSIGISVFDKDNQINLDKLIHQADKALYTAKNSGKDCIIVYKA